MQIKTSFGTRFKLLRKEHKLKQEDIAIELGVDISTIHRYENDKREPEYAILVKIADFFDTSTDYLLGRTETRKRI